MAYTDSAYLNTRISLLAGGLGRPGLIRKLITADTAGLESLVLQLGLPEQIADLTIAPEELDRQLHERLLGEVTLLTRAISGALREFVIYWLRQYEIMNIKAILRARVYGQSVDAEKIELVNIGSYSGLSPDTLRAAEDVSEILRVIERYGYSGLAQKARQNYEQRQDVFDLEAIIDRQYHVELMQHFRFLDRDQQELLRPVIGMLLDRINLVWLLRYRINYGMEASHIYYLLVPGGTWLNKSALMDMVRYDNLEEIRQFTPGIWRQVFVADANIEQVENAAEQLLYDFYIRLFRKSRNAEVRLICYLLLRQQQLKKISIIFKGRQIGLNDNAVSSAAGLDLQLDVDTGSEETLSRVKVV